MTLPAELEALRSALLSLTPAQQLAVEALSTGATHQTAGDAAGVTRETVTRRSVVSPRRTGTHDAAARRG